LLEDADLVLNIELVDVDLSVENEVNKLVSFELTVVSVLLRVEKVCLLVSIG
jgi:hypothetical protein